MVGFNVLLFLITMALFPLAAYKKHRAAFIDYRKKLIMQALGSVVVLCVISWQNYYEWSKDKTDNPFRNEEY